jgi:2,3-bisphosphoglycerate-independent phosphoglycerate mutase
MAKKPVCLIIRDGWGSAPCTAANGICKAKTPFTDEMEKKYPLTTIATSGLDVGLPEGTMGNSEVGHLNIGAGRIVYQSLTRINLSVTDGSLAKNPTLIKAINDIKAKNARLHLIGLVQDAGVHSHTDHALAIVKACKELGAGDRVLFHAITDGRDTPPQSAKAHMTYLDENLKRIGAGKIATVVGRYYAMDRDKRWERTKLAYDLVMKGEGTAVATWQDAIAQSYAAGENDEFVKAYTLGYDGIKDGDVVLFFNYRFDRTRQLTMAIVESSFKDFETVKHGARLIAMTHYYDNGNFEELFPEMEIPANFGETISKAGLTQLRTAETEKYAHVTFFFNSLKNDPYPGEDRILVDSPKVATYDLQPEMSVFAVKDGLLKAIASDKYDVIITNFANCDMVGHTGVPAAINKAVEAVDTCVGEVVTAVLGKGGVCLVTADHGNAEQMTLEDGSPMTAHTTNPVQCSLVGYGDVKLREGGNLGDIAPTLLQILGIKQPVEMTGKSLIA